jgi:hypothetical protein
MGSFDNEIVARITSATRVWRKECDGDPVTAPKLGLRVERSTGSSTGSSRMGELGSLRLSH